MITPEIKQKIIDKFTFVDEKGHALISPFIVSREKKVLYFHIAKTGGSSIDALLTKNGLNDHVLDNLHIDYKKRKEYFAEVVEEWDEYYKFTFIRNKYDLLVSLYHHDYVAPLNRCSFKDFLNIHVKEKSPLYPHYDFWIDQHFLTTIDDQIIFDFIGRFENYHEDMATVCKRIEIPYEDVRKNLGRYDKNKKYDSYYTPELKGVVDTKFAKEIGYFNWSD